MRYIITAQPAPETKLSDAPPSEALMVAYMAFNEEMHKAGVLVASEGLNPGAKSGHVVVSNGKRVIKDGPFAETKELIGGFYIIEVDSFEQALAWAQRCPVGLGFDDVLQVLPLTGAGDLPPEVVEVIRRAAPTWSATFEAKRK